MVSLVLLFSVFQITFVPLHGITLPFTSLAYTSLPSNPQCQLSSPTDEKWHNLPSSATTSNFQKSVQEYPQQFVNHETLMNRKENTDPFTRLLFDLNNSNRENETPIAINNIFSSYSKSPPSTATVKNNVISTNSAIISDNTAFVQKLTKENMQESPRNSNSNLRVMESKEKFKPSNTPQSKTDFNTDYERKDKTAENNIGSYSKAPPLTTTVKRENVLPISSSVKNTDSDNMPKFALQSIQEYPQNPDDNAWITKSDGNSNPSILPQSTNTATNRNYQRDDQFSEIKSIRSYPNVLPSMSTAKQSNGLYKTSNVQNDDFMNIPELSQLNIQEHPGMFVDNSVVTEFKEHSMVSTVPQIELNTSYQNKDESLPCTKTDNLIPTNTIDKNVDNEQTLSTSSPFLHQSVESPLDPVNYASVVKTKENSERSTLSQLDLTTNFKAADTSVNIKNLINSNTAGIPNISGLPPINLYNSGNFQKANFIKNDCTTKYPPIEVTPTNFVSSKDINSVNLKSSPPIVVKAVPYDTNRLNQHNLPPIFIDCSKQSSVLPNFNVNAFQLDQKIIPEKLMTQSVASGNSLCGAKEKVVNFNVPYVSNDCIMVSRPNDILNDGRKGLDINQHKQTVNIEKPVTVNKAFNPSISELKYMNDIVPNSANHFINSNEGIYKIKANYEMPNNIDKYLFTATTGINENSKLSTSPQTMKLCQYHNPNTNINSKTPLNKLNVQAPSITYAYIPKEIPIISQLPKVSPNPEIISFALKDISKPISMLCNPYNAMSHTHNYPSESIAQPKTTDTILVPMVNSKNDFNKPTLSLTFPKSLDCIPSSPIYFNSQSKVNHVPNLLELPKVYTNSEMLLSQPKLQYSPSLPSTVVIKNQELTSGSLQSQILSPFPIKSESDVGPLHLSVPSSKDTFNAPEFNIGNYRMPSYQSNSLCQNNMQPSKSYSYMYNDIPSSHLHVSPEITSQIPHINKLTVSPEASSFGDSLSNLISTLTSSLLSAYYDLSAKSDKDIVCNVPTVQEIITDLPSVIYPETFAPLSMPHFTLNPPMLSSPVSLPTPEVKYPPKRVGKKSSRKRKLSSSKLPKTYISSVLINILPPQEIPNEIIVIV